MKLPVPVERTLALGIIFTLLFLNGCVSPSAAVAAPPFTVVSAAWGSSVSPSPAAPGSENVPLTITLQYYFFNTAQGISVTLNLPTGFTDTSGNSVTTAYVPGQTPSGTVIPLTFFLNIASDAKLGAYTFAMSISWNAITSTSPIQTVAESQSASATILLRGNVLLQFRAGEPILSPGTVNTVPLIVTNAGTGNATNVDLTVTPQSSISSAGVSVLNTPPQISLIAPNSSVTSNVGIYAPQSIAGMSVTLGIGGSYTDPYGNTHPIAASIGIYVQSTASAPITITSESIQLTPGAVNNVTLIISNAGQLPLADLQVNVVLPPSVSLLKQFPVAIPNLAPGANAQIGMPIFVASALSGSPVTISATVSYTDTAGNTGSATKSLGFYVPISQSPNIGLSGYSYNPALIFPGMTVASLQVVLFNSGTTPGSNVNATLIPSAPVYSISGGSLTQLAGLLPVGQSATFVFTIGIRNSSLPVNSTLNLVVKSSGVAPTQFSIPFVEQPKADFRVVSVGSPDLASGDGADQLTVTLRNVGMAAAQVATFTLQPSYVFEPSTQGSFTTTPNAGIGTVPAGGTVNLTVVIQVNSNLQAGLYPLVFHATWSQLGSSQPFGQDLVLMLPVKSSVFQIANSVLFSLPFLVILVLVIVGLLVVRSRRRARRGSKPKEATA